MDITQFEQLVVSALEDVKAKDIQVINTTRLTSLFDRAIVASGGSNRQTPALARHARPKRQETYVCFRVCTGIDDAFHALAPRVVP